MYQRPLHINLDAGEGIVDERPLYPMVHALNVACGGHAGTKETLKQTIERGAALGLELGAHPSYPDPDHFGRRSLSLSKEALQSALVQQLDLFVNQIEKLGLNWSHLKAHGALYNDLSTDSLLAENFLKAITPFMSGKTLYVQEHSVLAQQARTLNIKCAHEYFIDRRYRNGQQLLSRKDQGAIIDSPEACLAHLRLMREGVLIDVKQQRHLIEAHTFCVHSDHPHTDIILKKIHGA